MIETNTKTPCLIYFHFVGLSLTRTNNLLIDTNLVFMDYMYTKTALSLIIVIIKP